MNTLLVAINSKFSHSNLAVRYLSNYIRRNSQINISFLELTINQNIDHMLAKVLENKPDVIGFSCYIWNIELVLQLSEIIKVDNSNISIILGGPEVSFESLQTMEKYPFIDFIIRGEGELPLNNLIVALYRQESVEKIPGLTHRVNNTVEVNDDQKLSIALDELSYPYLESEDFSNQYIYYETTRGCPFNCSFCLSSSKQGVRKLSLERIREDLRKIVRTKANAIKLVDRTFNFDKKRAMEIMSYIVEINQNNIKFHMELTAEILDDEFIEFINQLPIDMFQFEIGVQSTNSKTLAAVNRRSDYRTLAAIASRIIKGKNAHVHLDLIAGLPYQSYDNFRKSFNDIYNLKAEKLQLGFLKVLKGTSIRANADLYGIRYLDKAPYEVIRTNDINLSELLLLKKIESLVSVYYDEHYFINTLDAVMEFTSPFDFFEDFAMYWTKHLLFDSYHKRSILFDLLYGFIQEKYQLDVRGSLLDDFLLSEKNIEVPKYLYEKEEKQYTHLKHDLLAIPSFKSTYFEKQIDVPNKKLVNDFRLIEKDNEYHAYIYGDKNNIFDRSKKINVTKLLQGD
ncbi:MAG: Fe-S oxidoreductase [Clostridiales bacterium 38_11]|nr:MAG: Fe-S oxidoreductase [Clostridiales bacterium 38_11]HBH13311.1 B12-binding domain-containing radical SAM protein [Clostridiales bacterium]